MSNVKVICLQSDAFQKLVDEVVHRVLKENNLGREDKWIDDKTAMDILKVSSKTTLQKLRDEGHIRFSQPMHKVILYDRESIIEYIEKHAKDTF